MFRSPGRWSLKIRGVEVPPSVQRGQAATLRCLYDMDGDQLYSVKWYKDGTEFYRYMPSAPRPKTVFPDVPGADVNVSEVAVVGVQV